MLAGIAYTQGELGLDAPIGTYLPPDEGDADHRKITVRQLLTQTSGLQQAGLSEAVTAGLRLDPDLPRQALAMSIRHQPGTYFEYTQHGPDLLTYVIQQAVGDDLPHFAQTDPFPLRPPPSRTTTAQQPRLFRCDMQRSARTTSVSNGHRSRTWRPPPVIEQRPGRGIPARVGHLTAFGTRMVRGIR
ncbi:serine hydrolase [Nocardia africana]|uniref:Serine hydrolase n=1 Tax=Nocardia africana TaxID=134964 RepID=A0ABW6NV40_9NOCA